MASLENKLLQTWLAPTLKAAGFTKTGATWRRSRPPLIHVLNIQGSQWSRSFYFNLGIYLTDIGGLQRPLESQCHFRERLDQIVPDREWFFQLCDFEQNLPEEKRRAMLIDVIGSHAIPWLDQFHSKAQLQQYIRREQSRGLAISVDALEYLDIRLNIS